MKKYREIHETTADMKLSEWIDKTFQHGTEWTSELILEDDYVVGVALFCSDEVRKRIENYDKKLQQEELDRKRRERADNLLLELKTSYGDYLLDKVEDCYREEVRKSYEKIVRKIEKLL